MNGSGRQTSTVELLVAASTSSVVAFGGIALLVSAGVFLGPILETRRRAASVRTARGPSQPGAPDSGYQALFEAEQRRAYRIAVLMTGKDDRATGIVEETFARTLQQWTRLSADRRVWFVLSTDVKLCLGNAFVQSLFKPVARAGGGLTDELVRAASALAVLKPPRRAMAILAYSEGLSVSEVATVMGIEPARVTAELASSLEQLGLVLGQVAA